MGISHSTSNIQTMFENELALKESSNQYISVDVSRMAYDITEFLIKHYNSNVNIEKEIIRKWFNENWDSEFELRDEIIYEIRKAYVNDRKKDDEIIYTWWSNLD